MEAEFFTEAHQLCGETLCFVKNIISTGSQDIDNVLGLPSGTIQEHTFICKVISPFNPKTFPRTSTEGKMELVKGWEACIEIPNGEELLKNSKIVLSNDDTERIILRHTPQQQGNLHHIIII